MIMITRCHIFKQARFSGAKIIQIFAYIHTGFYIHICLDHTIDFVIDKHILHFSAHIHDRIQFLLHILIGMDHL